MRGEGALDRGGPGIRTGTGRARGLERRVLGLLDRLERGRLELTLPCGTTHAFEGESGGPAATLRLADGRIFRRVAAGGEIAFGEAFVDGWWDSDDPARLIELLHGNPKLFDSRVAFGGALLRAANRLLEVARRNTRAGSRRNVRRHYDLGDDLFESFLDPTMSYSCAVWDGASDTLHDAQRRKMSAVLGMAHPAPGGSTLEIGCGWGALAVETALRTGGSVRAITLSRNQRAAAERRAADAGVADRVQVEERDYRTVAGRHDAVVSVEMIEAVGHANLPSFFSACDRALAPGGRVALQAITVPDERYDGYRRGSDWLRKHIFPGGLAPSLAALRHAMRRSSSLEIVASRRIGPHYARTLRAWRDRFEAAWPGLAARGYDGRFRRLWRYYLAYCEGGFAAGTFDTLQLTLARPQEVRS